MKTALLVLILAISTGCGQTRGDVRSDPAAAVTATEEQLAIEGAALTKLTASGRRANCGPARARRENVCALARRICLLVSRDSAIADGPGRCKRARVRCQDANAGVNRICRR